MFSSSCLLAALLAGLSAAPEMAAAQSRFSVGVLECRAGSATSFIVGSVRDFDCLFTPTNGPLQRYGATIQRLGVDLGWSTSTVLVGTLQVTVQLTGTRSVRRTKSLSGPPILTNPAEAVAVLLAGRWSAASAGATVSSDAATTPATSFFIACR